MTEHRYFGAFNQALQHNEQNDVEKLLTSFNEYNNLLVTVTHQEIINCIGIKDFTASEQSHE